MYNSKRAIVRVLEISLRDYKNISNGKIKTSNISNIENNMGDIRGIYGHPAEETLISRPYFIDAGLFDDVDIIIDNHGGISFGTSWAGISALKPVELMMHSTNLLREHLMYSQGINLFGICLHLLNS